MTINAIWHRGHRMPKNATPRQRLTWHEAHAAHCDCRPFTAAMRQKLLRAIAARPKTRGANTRSRPVRAVAR